MLDEKKIRFYKHEILSITAGLDSAMDILIEELFDNESEMARLYQDKINKLNTSFENLLKEANIKL